MLFSYALLLNKKNYFYSKIIISQCANWLRYEKMYRMAIGTLAYWHIG